MGRGETESIQPGLATADRIHLAVLRTLLASGCTEPLERTIALAELTRRAEALRDENARVALESGETRAAVGRAMGVSRQAVRQRLG